MRFVPISVITILLLPLVAFAQFGGLGDVGGDAFSLSVTPQYPAPYSQVNVSVLSTSLSLTNATLAVSVGGKEIYRGAVHSFSIPLGRAGVVVNAKVTITAGGKSYSQTLAIQPQDIVLIAEPISSAPILYPGKPLVPLEGDVRVVAVANLRDTNGNRGNAATYAYAWTIDGVQMANSSGIGKSAIIVASPLQYRQREVSVSVTNSAGTLAGGASLALTVQEPTVRIYENDPLLGIRYGRALSGAYTIRGAETTLIAAPFSLPTTRGAPTVEWFLNGSRAQTGSSITLRPTGNGRGDASLSLTASAGNSTSATANLSLIFGAEEGFNLFGL